MPNIGLNGVTNMRKRIKRQEGIHGLETAEFCDRLMRSKNAADRWEYYADLGDGSRVATQFDTLWDALKALQAFYYNRWRCAIGTTADLILRDEINKYLYGE
jgi:hypothetical protein